MVKKFEISKELLRNSMLYDLKLGLKASESHERLCSAYVEGVVHYNTVQFWFKKFLSGNYDLEDDHSTGRPQEIDNDVLLQLVESDSRQTTIEML